MATDNFSIFAKAVAKRLAYLQSNGDLLQCNVDRMAVWDAYLAAFPEGTDPVFKTETEHTCNTCRSFFRQVGNVAVMCNGKIETLWDGLGNLPAPYDTVARDLSALLVLSGIEGGLKADSNIRAKLVDAKGFAHFHGTLDSKYWANGNYKDVLDSKTNALAKLAAVPLTALETVEDLIAENQIYRGAEFRTKVKTARIFVQKNQGLPASSLYGQTSKVDPHFLTSVVGVLVSNIAQGMPLETAVAKYEAMVAPTNYKRPKPVISQRMVDEALAKVASLGLTNALKRRMAVVSDISVNNVDWVNVDTQAQMKGGDAVRDLLMDAVAPTAQGGGSTVPVSMETFLSEVLPSAEEVEVFVANKHKGNFVALTAPEEADASEKALFNWGNSFGWSYEGGVTDSIKERVKRAGGAVKGLKMRVSLAWSNHDNLDIHCYAPGGRHVYYVNRAGILDVDMNCGTTVLDPVENMAFRTLTDGLYRFRVHNYQARHLGGEDGFTLEVQLGDGVRQFHVPTNPRNRRHHTVDLRIEVKRGVPTIVKYPGQEGSASQEVWAVDTESFVPVGAVLRSPNHWDGNATGNKHWIFALQGCVPDAAVPGLYNEFLAPSLRNHRKVFEVLSQKALCQPEQGALCGLGFSTTRKDVVTLRVKAGKTTRLYDVTVDA